ncbi:S8 family peptidase [Virgibacillus sp. FSP13]
MKRYMYVFLAFALIVSLFFFESGNVSADTAAKIAPASTKSIPSILSQSSESTTQLDDSYVVTFNAGTSIEQMKSTIKQYSGKIVDSSFNSQTVKIHLSTNQYKKMKNAPNVKFIEENHTFHTLGFGPLIQYSHEKTHISNAWDQDLKGKGIDIAILDTGISSHDDLNVAGGSSTVSYTDSYNDDNGHGTHVAGIVASKDDGRGTTGVASEANIYSVKVLKGNGKGDLMDIIEGIDWSIRKGVDIINVSLGSKIDSKTLKAKIDEARSKGIIVVAAAGNTGDTHMTYPAKYDDVVAVGATDKNNYIASFSSRGDELDVVAPGVEVVSTYLGNMYANGSGTSQAAPYVSGMLALLKEEHPSKSADELIQTLYDDTLDLGVKGKDPLYGYGFVQFPNEEKADDIDSNKMDKVDEKESTGKDINEELDTLNYTDVKPGDSHYPGVKWLTENGIKGYSDGTFGVGRDLTRPHSAIMFTRALHLNIPSAESIEDYFDDVSPNHIYAEFIAATGKAGIFKGSNGKFLPNKKLDRWCLSLPEFCRKKFCGGESPKGFSFFS